MPYTLPPTLAALLLAASTASAAITIPTVSVGNAGNDADPATGNVYGSVSYEYRIGTHEVTNSQYTDFLNATAATDTHSLYNSNMSSNSAGGINQSGTSGSYNYSVKSGFGNKPVNYVSFYDAARFSNWLMNGQPGTGGQTTSTTEDGFYTFSGTTNITAEAAHSGSQVGGMDWVAVASEDEWYKAAYYDGNGGYYEYPTQSNTAPTAVNPPGGANSANFTSAVGTVTDVGAYTNSGSHYGTFDQGGNVWEWNDAIVGTSTINIVGTSQRVLRGGSFFGFGDAGSLLSSVRNGRTPTDEDFDLGFRVSSLAPIPEPSSYGAIFGIVGLATAVFFRRRRRRE